MKKYHLYAFKDVAIFMVILLVFHVLWRTFVGEFFALDFIKFQQTGLPDRFTLELVGF